MKTLLLLLALSGCYDARAATHTSADNQSLSRSSGFPSATTLTFCAWVDVTTDRNAGSCLIDISDITDSSHFQMETDATGTQFQLNDGNALVLTMVNAAVNSWYYMCGTKSGTTFAAFWSAANGGALSTASGTSAATFTAGWSGIRIGKEEFNASTFLNGRVAAIKIWDGVALTSAEMANEQWHYRPISHTESLFAWWPMWNLNDKTVDYSRNAHPLTAGSATTTVAGPPAGY